MNSLDWLSHAFMSRGVPVPARFALWLTTGEQELGDWYLLSERGAVVNGASQGQLYPSRDVLPFARRGDRDDVACLVLRDSEHPPGSVLIVHEGAMSGYEVEEVLGSITQWFEQAYEAVRLQTDTQNKAVSEAKQDKDAC